MGKAKSFSISKEEVRAAYEQVKANKGAAGVDRQTLSAFERKLEDNLYKLWNRLSSGSYYRSALEDVVRQLDLRLGKWAEWKYKKFRGHSGRAIKWVRGVRKREPKLFAHWQLYPKTAGL